MVPALMSLCLLPKWNLSQCIFYSIPKLICIVWQYRLIPIELLLGSAEDANMEKGGQYRKSQLGGFRDLLRLCIFALEWKWDKNWEIVWLRFVLTDLVLQGLSVFPVSSRQFEMVTTGYWTEEWASWTSWWQVLGNVWIHSIPMMWVLKVL